MLIQILLIGVSVSMDAFAVSIGKGLTVKKLRGVDAFKTALWFGGFQALFPLFGYFAASTFSKYVTAVDHWIIFGLLALIGGNMVREAFEEDEENAKETPEFDWKHMLPLAVACSIDAFAVGVSFAFMTLNIWLWSSSASPPACSPPPACISAARSARGGRSPRRSPAASC